MTGPSRRPITILPLAIVLIAAPYFGDYRERPLRFGLLQGLLIIFISIGVAGGLKPWRQKMRQFGFAAFWLVLFVASVAAPFLPALLSLHGS